MLGEIREGANRRKAAFKLRGPLLPRVGGPLVASELEATRPSIASAVIGVVWLT